MSMRHQALGMTGLLSLPMDSLTAVLNVLLGDAKPRGATDEQLGLEVLPVCCKTLFQVLLCISPLAVPLRARVRDVEATLKRWKVWCLGELHIVRSRLDVEDIKVIVKIMQVNLSLNYLSLLTRRARGCSLTGDAQGIMQGMGMLADALRVNTSLTALDLSSNNISSEGVVPLADAFRTNTSLTYLNLQTNFIGDEGGVALADALRINTSLTDLNLWNNSIGDAGGVAIAEALAINTSLTNLNISYNKISDAGGVALADALHINAKLTVLGLRFNDIGPEGGVALADALRANASLTELETRDNRISGDSAEQLSAAVLSSSSLLKFSAVPMRELRADELTVLDLSTKDLGPTEVRVLGGLLVANTLLMSLDLQDIEGGPEGGVALADALRSNTSLTEVRLSFPATLGTHSIPACTVRTAVRPFGKRAVWHRRW